MLPLLEIISLHFNNIPTSFNDFPLTHCVLLAFYFALLEIDGLRNPGFNSLQDALSTKPTVHTATFFGDCGSE